MKINLKKKTRNDSCEAVAVYDGHNVIVKKGGRITLDFDTHIRAIKIVKAYRENAEYVNTAGIILKDCIFSSPSSAAQFVTGRSTNGYEAWKVEPKKTLDKYLKEKGLR